VESYSPSLARAVRAFAAGPAGRRIYSGDDRLPSFGSTDCGVLRDTGQIDTQQNQERGWRPMPPDPDHVNGSVSLDDAEQARSTT
jgi:hypothetical protein